MSFQRWPHTLQAKATLIVIGIVVLALILAEVIERAYVTDLAKENMRLKTISLLRHVNAQIQSTTQMDDEHHRKKILSELMERTPNVLYISLYQVSGLASHAPQLLSQMGEGSPPINKGIPPEVTRAVMEQRAVSTPQDTKHDHMIKVALPITIEREIKGVAYAEFWTGQFDSLTSFFHRWSQSIRVGLGVILVVSINGFLYVWVLRPLATIGDGLASLGKQEWKVRVHVGSEDEIGTMAKSFNAMAEQIGTVMEENYRLTQAITQSRDELQHRVDYATAELLKNNESLSQLNEQLSVAQREVLHHQRLAVLGQLVATIAHKIGTPLTAISGHLQLLQETPTLLPEVKDRVKTLLQQTDRLEKVIQNLLSAASPPALHIESVRVQVLVEQMIGLFRPICDEKRITIVTDYDPSIESIKADPAHLQEALGNLIDNSIDAMPNGGQLALRVYLSRPHDGKKWPSQVIIEITDTGPGIPQSQQQQIFDPFFTTKEMGKGTGLGLAIAKEIVALHGGSLTVRSEEGQGASFLIALPG